MKKYLTILLVLISLNLCLTAYAIGNPSFNVSSCSAKPGETVKVTVSVNNNPGITSMKLYVSFNSILELEKVEYNSAFSGQTMQPSKMESPVTLIWLSPFTNCNVNGTFATLTFKVKSNASVGDSSDITISYNPDDVYNLDETNVDFDTINGKVTVSGDNISATGVTLSKTTTTIKTGEQDVLTATVKPENATNTKVTWRSSDASVASVSNGTVTGNKKGTTTITATTADGGYKAECTVTVNCSHDNLEKIPEKDSTCTEQGWEEYYVCSDCGQTISSDGVSEVASRPFRPLAKHTGGTATCNKKAICTVCGNSYGSLNGHNYSDQIKKEEAIKKAATCQNKAEYYYSCSVCGSIEKNDSHIFYGSTTSHSFTKYISDGNATTEADGTKTAKCDYCNETDTVIDIGSMITSDHKHSFSTEYKISSNEHWKVCACGAVAEKANHTFGEWIIVKKATTTATGTRKQVCKICEYEKTEIIPKATYNKNASIKVAGAKTVDYRSNVTIVATATGIDSGYHLEIVVGNTYYKGSQTEVKAEIGEIKSDVKYEVRVVKDNGEVQNDLSKSSKVTCNATFFKKLIAFFKGLFGMLPTVTIKP